MKYPHILSVEELNEEQKEMLFSLDLHVFEKLDGGNTQISRVNGKLSHGLRSGNASRFQRAPWKELFDKFFWENQHEFEKLAENVVCFFEFLAPHRVKYKEMFENRPFLIDVYNTEKNEFFDYEDARKIVSPLNIPAPTPEPLYKGGVDEKTIKALLQQESQYAVDGVKEGLVLKSYSHQFFAKAYHPRYKQENLGN